MKRRRVIVTSALLAAVFGCGTDWSPDQLADGKTSPELQLIAQGREAYGIYCVGCHGEKGDGKGPAAEFMDPQPRDFTGCRLKFASVPSGELPLDQDIVHAMTHGLSGTAMPGFPFLPQDEKDAIVAYLKTFCEQWQQPGRSAPAPLNSNPWADDPEGGIEEGRIIYHAFARCWSCHPAYETKADIVSFMEEMDMPPAEFGADLYESKVKKTDWGENVAPPDFFYHRMKTGVSVEALAQVIGAGVGGTAMPTWAGIITDKQLWGMAEYVRHLALMRGTPEARAIEQKLATQPEWKAPVPVDAAPAEGTQEGGAQ